MKRCFNFSLYSIITIINIMKIVKSYKCIILQDKHGTEIQFLSSTTISTSNTSLKQAFPSVQSGLYKLYTLNAAH